MSDVRSVREPAGSIIINKTDEQLERELDLYERRVNQECVTDAAQMEVKRRDIEIAARVQALSLAISARPFAWKPSADDTDEDVTAKVLQVAAHFESYITEGSKS